MKWPTGTGKTQFMVRQALTQAVQGKKVICLSQHLEVACQNYFAAEKVIFFHSTEFNHAYQTVLLNKKELSITFDGEGSVIFLTKMRAQKIVGDNGYDCMIMEN